MIKNLSRVCGCRVDICPANGQYGDQRGISTFPLGPGHLQDEIDEEEKDCSNPTVALSQAEAIEDRKSQHTN